MAAGRARGMGCPQFRQGLPLFLPQHREMSPLAAMIGLQQELWDCEGQEPGQDLTRDWGGGAMTGNPGRIQETLGGSKGSQSHQPASQGGGWPG